MKKIWEWVKDWLRAIIGVGMDICDAEMGNPQEWERNRGITTSRAKNKRRSFL